MRQKLTHWKGVRMLDLLESTSIPLGGHQPVLLGFIEDASDSKISVQRICWDRKKHDFALWGFVDGGGVRVASSQGHQVFRVLFDD
jgi:hypothetical protein